MKPSPEVNKFLEAMRVHDDLGMARKVLQRHPSLVSSPTDASFLMHDAAMEGKTQYIALLHEFGVDVNIPRSSETPQRPIWTAVVQGEIETVRWLIEHGSDINWGDVDERPYCVPLPVAIRERYDEIVKLLVEAGADLLAKDRNNLTPLDWAVAVRPEMVDYLRSKGAKRSTELPGYVPPPPPPKKDRIVNYAETIFGYSLDVPFAPILPETVPIGIHGHGTHETCSLFTKGMSEQPMTVPPGGEAYQYAELLMQFPFEWWPQDGDWTQDRCRWLLQWLYRVAQIPFETNTWFGGQWGIISNEEPPVPLSAFTPTTCWLLLAEKGPLTRFERDDGRSVVFYTMIPIHTAERDLVLQAGIVELLKKFAQNDIPDYIVPDRPSVV